MKIGEYYKCQEVMETKNVGKLFNFLPVEVACQPKLDGIRLQIHKNEDSVTVFSKKGIDVTHRFKEIAKAAKQIPKNNFILDGEGICFYNGRINFNKVLSKLRSGVGNCIFFGFDALMLDNTDLTKEPYYTRRSLLDKIQISNNIRVVPQIITCKPSELRAFYIESLKKGFEGIVYREIYSQYYSGLSSFVRKLKPLKTLDVEVVLGHEKKDGYYSYDVKVKEGMIGKIATKEIIESGKIIEVRHDGIMDSKNEVGKSLRFPTLFRIREDLKQPNSLGDKIEAE